MDIEQLEQNTVFNSRPKHEKIERRRKRISEETGTTLKLKPLTSSEEL